MFDIRRDDSAAITVEPNGAANGDVAGFGAAAGERDLVCIGTDQRRDLAARGLDGVVRACAQGGVRRRIAELALQIWHHGLQHGGIDRRRAIVVEINRGHFRFTILKT